ncbi:MAG: hypothetical protein ACK4VI_07660 [Alphaproteobacteria bacterium]
MGKAAHWTAQTIFEDAYRKRRLNSLLNQYREFCRDFLDADDEELLKAISSNQGMDKWVNIGGLALDFHMAACIPVHATPYDRQKYLLPLFDQLRRQIQTGVTDAHIAPDANTIDECYVRPCDLWNLLKDAPLPDGGRHHKAPSRHTEHTRNDEIPFTLTLHGKETEQWLNIRLPLIFALAVAEDYTRTIKKRTPYSTAKDGAITMHTNNPYLA